MPSIIHVDGRIEELKHCDLSLEKMQEIIGGYVEVVHFIDQSERVLVVNEDGKREKLPFNPVATALIKPYVREGDYIAGNAILCLISDLEDVE